MGLSQLLLESHAREAGGLRIGEVTSNALLAGLPQETWLSVTVAHPLLVIFSSMWHLGLLPTSDEYTSVNTHTHTII